MSTYMNNISRLIICLLTFFLCNTGIDACTIPLVDMKLFNEGTALQREAFAKQFGEALEVLGFVAVNNTAVDPALVKEAYSNAQSYFSLPQEIKMENFVGDGLHGFIPFGTEHAKDSLTPDLKEFYQMFGSTNSKQLWPKQHLPAFESTISELYTQLEDSVKQCLMATAIYLGYSGSDENLLADMVGDNHSVLRILHFPPLSPEMLENDTLRSAPHQDLCMMIITPQASSKGLQVLPKGSGGWINVTIPDGAVLISAGDTLSKMTQNRIPSTITRVTNTYQEYSERRYSLSFYGQPSLDTRVAVLSKCRPLKGKVYKDFIFGDFLKDRLNAIGMTQS